MSVIAESGRTDWTTCDEHNSCEPIRWQEWMERAIDAIRGMDRGLPFDGEHAIEGLLRMAMYLDAQYDIGYDGIALLPRENFVVTFDR